MIFIGPETLRLRETLQGKAGIGPGRLGQPEVTAAGVNARRGAWRQTEGSGKN